jgi:hypothetical protein
MVCKAVTLLWVPLAPVFFFMPDGLDGIYERGLGLVTFAFVVAIALTLRGRADALEARRDRRADADAAIAAE